MGTGHTRIRARSVLFAIAGGPHEHQRVPRRAHSLHGPVTARTRALLWRRSRSCGCVYIRPNALRGSVARCVLWGIVRSHGLAGA